MPATRISIHHLPRRLQFVPITDELLERHPELLERLIPYQRDYPCLRWQAIGKGARVPELGAAS